MKKILTLLLVLAWTTSVWTTNININDPVVLVVRSIFLDGNYGTPDSVRITTWYSGSQAYDAWFNTGDGECYAANGWLAFTDVFSDIDGGGGDGSYTVIISAYDDDSTLYTDRAYSYTVGGSVESVSGAVGSVTNQVTANVTAISGSTPAADSAELVFLRADHSNMDEAISGRSAIGDTNQVDGISTFDPTTDVVVADDTMSTGDSLGTKENQTSILAYFDTLIYVGPRGLGIYLDSAAGNANTVIGTDGTSKNPVSTIAAAKTIATALGYNRYYFLNSSTFNDAANDIPSSHQNWEFFGIGQGNQLAFGTQRVDGSRFDNMDLSGTMHASGGNVLYTNCTFGYITADFNGHAFNCWLEDTIVVKAGQDIDFARCQSGVTGNRTPTIDLSGGSSVVQLRGYSGGIRIMSGASNDTVSIETDGQVIVSANNTSLNITLRGMMTVTDSGTTTNLTKDAVFSRAEADLWVWANADTAHVDSSDQGVWLVNNLGGGAASNWSDAQRDSVLDNMKDGAITATKIATNAIGATEIAANAIGADEIAPNAIGASEIATDAIGNDELADDLDFDSLSFKVVTMINTGSDPGLTIKSVSGDAVYFQSLGGSGKAALYLDADGTSGIGLRAEGVQDGIKSVGGALDLNLTLNLGDVTGQLGASAFADSFITEPKLKGKLFIAQKFNTDAFTADVFAANAIGSSELATDAIGNDELADDITFDSLHFRTIVINQTGGTGYGLYIASNQDNDAALLIDGTGTSTDGARFSGTDKDFEVTLNIDDLVGDFETADFEDSVFNAIKFDTDLYDTLTQIINDNAGTVTLPDSVVARIDSLLRSVGIFSDTSITIKLGAYDGTGGDDTNVKEDIAAISAPGGSGAYSCSLHVLEGASAITSGSIRMISGVNEYVLPIDANGWVEFSLDGGTWSAYATALRFVQDTIPQTITFSTHHIDTISMTAFSPSTPTDTGKVVLYVWTDRVLGDTLEGATLRVIPLDKGKNWVTGGNRMILTGEVTAKTDSTGYAEIEVYQSSFVSPYPSGSDSLKYNISVTYPGLSSWAQFRFAAPDTGSQYQIGVIE